MEFKDMWLRFDAAQRQQQHTFRNVWPERPNKSYSDLATAFGMALKASHDMPGNIVTVKLANGKKIQAENVAFEEINNPLSI